MFTKILFPIDFSVHARKVKEEILKIKDCGINEIVLLHVINKKLLRYSPISHELTINDMFIDGDIARNAELKLKDWAKDLDNTNITIKYDIVKGNPFDEIIGYSQKEKCTLIIMGFKGLTETEDLLIGSTAEKVARKSKIPVMIIK